MVDSQATDYYTMDIRKIVKSRLRALGLSQYWLAQQVGMSRQGLGMYLRGKNDMNGAMLGKVLDALDLKLVGEDVIGKLKVKAKR